MRCRHTTHVLIQIITPECDARRVVHGDRSFASNRKHWTAICGTFRRVTMKVLLAVDGSPDTKRMLAYLATHEDLLGASPKYVVLNVQSPVPGGASKFVNKETVAEYHQAEAETVLAPVTKFLDRHGVTYTSSYRVGHAAEEILRSAKRAKADLIVMGSRGRGGIGSLLLGSVAQTVLAASDIPVMVVR